MLFLAWLYTPRPPLQVAEPKFAVSTRITECETPNPWFTLEAMQGSMTREEFAQKLKTLYDPFDATRPYFEVNEKELRVRADTFPREPFQYVVRFASGPEKKINTTRFFRAPEQVRALPKPPGKPLAGLRLAIDPGHIGGEWAVVEERSSRYRGSAPVEEGTLNLITANILKKTLTELGAEVYLVRESNNPVTSYRPQDFRREARELVLARNPGLAQRPGPVMERRVKWMSEFLFYRCSEIMERGFKIRNNFTPDLTLTLYLNATARSAWGGLTPINRNIFFVHGSYTPDEVKDPRQRLRMVYKILEGGSAIEREVAVSISNAFREMTGFKPVMYGNSRTTRLVEPGNPYVVARNLAANRNYAGPCVCTEPYFMNQQVTYRRLLAGDYEGTRKFDGQEYRSIFRDYADAVTKGLLKCYGSP